MLFDQEVSGSSCKNAFNSSIGVQSDEIDLSDILSGMMYALIHIMLTAVWFWLVFNMQTVERQLLSEKYLTPNIKLNYFGLCKLQQVTSGNYV